MTLSMNVTPAIRILLAEDDEAMRTYLERALANAGYEVTAVDRGTEAAGCSGDHRCRSHASGR